MNDKKIIQIPAFDYNHFMTGNVFQLSGRGMHRKLVDQDVNYDYAIFGVLTYVSPNILKFHVSYTACNGGDIRFIDIDINIHDYEDDVNIDFMVIQ